MSTDPLSIEGLAPFETAAGLACVQVPVSPAHRSVADMVSQLAGRYESASHVVVCDGPAFLGMVRIEDLIAAPPDATLGQLMDSDAPTVAPHIDQEVAAWHAVSKGWSALAVVDTDRRFIGVIPPMRLLNVLLWEHEEDLTRLGGFVKQTAQARTSSTEPVQRRFRHRMPWLLMGLGGAMLAAELVGWFELHIQQQVMLAFFIPSIVYLADAVGTQTETVVVRGLSVGVAMRGMVRRELMVGLAIGLVLAALAGPLIWWRWGDADMALCVALAMFAACSTATVMAMALPWLFSQFRIDPAFGSGPLATVVQDLLSILLYFVIAATVLG